MISPGNIVKIDIKVTNNGEEEVSGTLNDFLPDFATIIDEKETEEQKNEFNVDNVKTFQLTIAKKDSVFISYSAGFFTIPEQLLNKPFFIGKAAFTDKENNQYFSENIEIFIKSNKEFKCNFNFLCEEGENYENCFQDCTSGHKDSYCDELKDGRCDPDCAQNKDSDCRNKERILYYLLGILILSLLGAAFLIYYFVKRRKMTRMYLNQIKR